MMNVSGRGGGGALVPEKKLFNVIILSVGKKLIKIKSLSRKVSVARRVSFEIEKSSPHHGGVRLRHFRLL
jgi:hypothetical protein